MQVDKKIKSKIKKSCYNCKYQKLDGLTIYPVYWCNNPDSPVNEIPPKRKYCRKFEPDESLKEYNRGAYN